MIWFGACRDWRKDESEIRSRLRALWTAANFTKEAAMACICLAVLLPFLNRNTSVICARWGCRTIVMREDLRMDTLMYLPIVFARPDQHHAKRAKYCISSTIFHQLYGKRFTPIPQDYPSTYVLNAAVIQKSSEKSTDGKSIPSKPFHPPKPTSPLPCAGIS